MIVLAAACVCACSKDGCEGSLEPAEGGAIRLNAGVPSADVRGKGPINNGSKFTPAVAGWENSASETYGSAPTWATTASEITASASASAVTLAEAQYYSSDRSVTTYMKAWYPRGTLSNGTVTFSASDTDFAGDGTDDVLLAPQVSGSREDVSPKTLSFAHLTTQLKFCVVGEKSLASGVSVTGITLKSVSVPGSIALGTDKLSGAAAADLPLPGLSTSSGVSIPVPASGAASAEAVSAGDPVMICPPAGNSISVDVTTSLASYSNVSVTIDSDAGFVAGKAYTITLTFRQTGISLSATVADWTTGSGSGTVE